MRASSPTTQRVRGRLLHRATKTEESYAPLPLPAICVTALRHRYRQQAAAREKAGGAWHDTGMTVLLLYKIERGHPEDPEGPLSCVGTAGFNR